MRSTPLATRTLKYRPEIDGLRAVAILPVVLFHYRVPYFSGGFVGVDVFFVISGFLITSLIAGEMADGRFSILHFYERRIRRIFPALFAMLAVATLAAYFLFFPADLLLYADSLLATAGFASNFEFWREAGYFDAWSFQKPLLHLWSIAAEEQFYLLFPAFLAALGNRGRLRLAGLLALLILSFATNLWEVVHAPDAAFYLLPSRAWELMLGAVLATDAVPPLRNRLASECASAFGIVLIAVAVLSFHADRAFPGAAALVPCFGAALVIYGTSGTGSIMGRALSIRPLVFVGLISYSLYLWHWPIYVFARYLLFRDLTGGESAALIVMSFVLATLSWRFIEQPLRRPIARTRLFPAAATAMAVAFAAGAVGASTDGLPQRMPARLQRILAEQDDHEPRLERCFPMTARDVEKGRLCAIGAEARAPSFLLWGDSHADAIEPPIEQIAKRAQRTGLLAGGASCPPLLDVTTPSADCRPFNDAVARLALSPHIADVILEARWAKYADGDTYGDEPHGHVLLTDSASPAEPPADNHAVFARGLERTIQTLVRAGKHVTLIASVPEVGFPVPAVLARRALARDAGLPHVSIHAFEERQKFVLAVFARMQRLYNVTVVSPGQVLCAKDGCVVAIDGIPLYRDEHHLSVYGALKLESLFERVL